MNFKKLEWDSDFFSFDVAQIEKLNNESDFYEVCQSMASSNVTLAYYFSDREIDLIDNEFYSTSLIDIKVLYLKKITETPDDSHVQLYKEDFPDKKLLELSIESGVHSRFKKDKLIPVSKYEELYKIWLINSVNKQIAESVLIYNTKDGIGGFVTVGVKNNRADLGIMAVDANYRGMGIASSLMRCAENLMAKRFSEIQILTQEDNFTACRLYEKFGYKVVKKEFVYHVWRNTK